LNPGQSASELISGKIAEIGGWRGETLGRMRKIIKDADPDVVEELKWIGTPVWSRGGIICTGESYKKVVKLTFAKGASLTDPAHLFNSSLEGNVRRNRHPRRRRSGRGRLQGTHSPSDRSERYWQVETVEESKSLRESEILRDSAPEEAPSWPRALRSALQLSRSSLCGHCLPEPAPPAGRSAPSESRDPNRRGCAGLQSRRIEW